MMTEIGHGNRKIHDICLNQVILDCLILQLYIEMMNVLSILEICILKIYDYYQ